MRTVAIAVLTALAAVALRGHIPAADLNPFAGALARPAALAIAIVVLCAALFVFAGPLMARIVDWHRTAIADDGAGDPERHPGQSRRPITNPSLKSLAGIGVCLALVAEFVALSLPADTAVQALPGTAVGLILLRMCTSLGVRAEPPAPGTAPDDVGESLQRSISQISTRIIWSEGTRSDWDLRVRPVLARQFEMATKASQRRMTDPAAFEATGLMLFGAGLWQWVDPNNIDRDNGARKRGPGRKVLEDIIECLEQV